MGVTNPYFRKVNFIKVLSNVDLFINLDKNFYSENNLKHPFDLPLIDSVLSEFGSKYFQLISKYRKKRLCKPNMKILKELRSNNVL